MAKDCGNISLLCDALQKVPCTHGLSFQASFSSSRLSSNFNVDILPNATLSTRSPSVCSVKSGVASLLHRATNRGSNQEKSDTSSIYSITSTASNAFSSPHNHPHTHMSSHAGSGRSLHKKTSNLSSGTEASISKEDLGSKQHPECSPSDGNYSPQTPSRSATSSLRRLAAPPSSFSPKGIHTSNLDPPREQGRTQDIFDDANLVTSTDIKREIAAVEAEAAEETLPSHPSLPSLPSLDLLDSLQLNNKELVPSFLPPPPALPPSSSAVSSSVSSTFSGSTLTFSMPSIPLPLTVTTSDGGSAPHLEDPLVAPRAQKVDPEIPANMARNLDETLRGVSPPVPVSLNNPGGFNIPSPQPPLQASLPDPNPTPNPNPHRSYYGGSMLVTDNNNIHKEPSRRLQRYHNTPPTHLLLPLSPPPSHPPLTIPPSKSPGPETSSSSSNSSSPTNSSSTSPTSPSPSSSKLLPSRTPPRPIPTSPNQSTTAPPSSPPVPSLNTPRKTPAAHSATSNPPHAQDTPKPGSASGATTKGSGTPHMHGSVSSAVSAPASQGASSSVNTPNRTSIQSSSLTPPPPRGPLPPRSPGSPPRSPHPPPLLPGSIQARTHPPDPVADPLPDEVQVAGLSFRVVFPLPLLTTPTPPVTVAPQGFPEHHHHPREPLLDPAAPKHLQKWGYWERKLRMRSALLCRLWRGS
ncbi:hypothetical protein C8J55DRAFT_567029 [Lentinula edodes]|uniref:Uncharacterized protein n=1 Tax=Lentinula lateritia TaxID=40482 RepID=A0A9W9DD59_9AGAR|nr:hypothetical protein C8J55DRAFT_567029 [Lentinula edodes]